MTNEDPFHIHKILYAFYAPCLSVGTLAPHMLLPLTSFIFNVLPKRPVENRMNMTLPPVQTSAFGMTLLRKNLISKRAWTAVYVAELLLVYVYWLLAYGNVSVFFYALPFLPAPQERHLQVRAVGGVCRVPLIKRPARCFGHLFISYFILFSRSPPPGPYLTGTRCPGYLTD